MVTRDLVIPIVRCESQLQAVRGACTTQRKQFGGIVGKASQGKIKELG